MLRLVSLPFSLFLLVLSVGLVAAGLSLVADATQGGGGGGDGGGSLLDVDLGSRSDSSSGRDDGATVAGVSMIGFGILGAIAAVALLVAALSGGREPEPVQMPAQQQQQQVVVVTDGEARVETGQGR